MRLFQANNRRLKNEFVYNTMITTILMFVIILTSVIYLNVKMYREEIYFKNGLISQSLVTQLNEHIYNQVKSVSILASIYDDSNNFANTKEDYLKQGLSYDDMFLKIQVLDQSGVLIDTSSNNKENIGLDLSTQPYISVLNKEGDYYYSNSFFSKEFDAVLVSLSYQSAKHYYVAYLDLSHFYSHLVNLSLDDKMEYLLLDSTDTIISSSLPGISEARSKMSFFSRSKSLNNEYNYIRVKNTLYLLNESKSNLTNWTVAILSNNAKLISPIYQMIAITVSISLVMILITFLYQRRRINYIVNKLNELNKNLTLIERGNYDFVFTDNEFYELNNLSEHFIKSLDKIQMREMEIKALNNNLELLVEERTTELSDKNEELYAIVSELENTQDLLIESEKQASFSRLIAGIAHEINTPIGVSITLSSYLIESANKLEKAYLEKKLTKSAFKEHLDKFVEVSNLILENLIKSGDLISSFKKASNNNFTYDLCEYNIYELTTNLIKSIKTHYKSKNYTIDLQIDPELTLISYPSAMSQILTNLISNAITHGLKNKENGIIIISCKPVTQSNAILLEIEDNGSGITAENMVSIFEPFFTTNREDGGMGLGLSIIKNLVINKLNGSINIDSKVDQFTKFTISIPNESLKSISKQVELMNE